MKKAIWLMIAAALLLTLLAGCRQEPSTPDDTASDTESASNGLDESGEILLKWQQETPYVILVGTNADTLETEAATRLRNSFRQFLQIDLPIRIDLIRESAGYTESPYEILIGATNRSESDLSALQFRSADWCIRKAGSKLVLAGGTPQATGLAVDGFIERFLEPSGGTLRLTDADSVTVQAAYSVPSFTVDGIEQKALQVVWNGKNQLIEAGAETLAAALTDCYGYSAKAVAAYQAEAGTHQLQTATLADLPELSELLADQSAVLTARNGSAVLLAKDTASLICAMHDLACALKSSGALTLASGETVLPISPPETLSAMSFNIYGSTDFTQRRNAVLNVIATYLPDTFGIQEGKNEWVSFFASSLSDLYAAVGEGNREAGTTETYNNLYYRKDRFTLLENGTIWLSDNIHEAGSKLPESKRVRTATYALLQEKASGKTVLYVNTHLDNQSAQAREKQLVILMRLIHSFDAPCVLTGDFNSTPTSNVYSLLSSVMEDARVQAAERDTTPTYNGLGESTHTLDYCFFSEESFELLRYHVHGERYQGTVYPSDHNAVITEYRIK